MLVRTVAALSLSFAFSAAWAQAEAPAAEPAPATEEAQPEKILVVGQRPGPGLWKVSKGEHVMWVFGTYSPLPKKMEWRSQQVEAIMAQSQELLTQPFASLEVGRLRSLTLLPFMIGMDKNPDGAQLRDKLPADVYERWLVLRKKYLNDDDGFERQRPVFAAGELYEKSLAHAGLVNGSEVRKTLLKLAEKNKLKITSTKLEIPVDSPVKVLREFKKTPMDDVACFTDTLARVENDLDAMRVRANAWAKGDLDAIRKLHFPSHEEACNNAILNNTLLKEKIGTDGMMQRVRATWLAAAEKALEANKSTVALLPLKELLDPKGYLAGLQAKGYAIEQPD